MRAQHHELLKMRGGFLLGSMKVKLDHKNNELKYSNKNGSVCSICLAV